MVGVGLLTQLRGGERKRAHKRVEVWQLLDRLLARIWVDAENVQRPPRY